MFDANIFRSINPILCKQELNRFTHCNVKIRSETAFNTDSYFIFNLLLILIEMNNNK